MNKCCECGKEAEKNHALCGDCEYKESEKYREGDNYINEHNLVDVGGYDFSDD